MATNEAILEQNKKLTIVPAGIKRHQHDLNCLDDGCEEVINMRYKNGVWKTVGEKATEWEYDHGCHTLYYHSDVNKKTGTNFLIGAATEGINVSKIYLIDPATSTKTLIKTIPNDPFERFSSFASLNSILIVYTERAAAVGGEAIPLNAYYFKWDDNTDAYLELTKDIVPQVYFSYEHVEEFTVPPVDTTETEDFFQTQKELFDAIIIAKYKMRQKGLFCHAYTVMQWAYRMWDGSYIMHSQPYLLRLSDEEAYFTKVISETPTEEVYGCTLRCGKPIFYLNAPAAYQTNLTKYKGLITHLCVFMTQDVSQYLYEVNLNSFGDESGYAKYAFSNNTESLDQLMNAYPLYLAKEVPLDEILDATMGTTKFTINVNELLNKLNYVGDGGESIDTVEKIPVRHNTYSWKRLGDWNWARLILWGGQGWAVDKWGTKGVSYSTKDADQSVETTDEAGTFVLQAQPELPVDDFTHHDIIGLAVPYVYNSKLHLGNIRTRFWKGDDPTKWKYGVSTNTAISGFTFYREITLETDRGTRYVVETFDPWYNEITGESVHWYNFYLPNVISYPDIRATRIRIVYTTAGVTRLLRDYSLTPHKMYNFAYCITNRRFESDDTGYLVYDDDAKRIDLNDLTTNPITTLQTDNRYYTDSNRIQVSRSNNALYYPSLYSYQIGNSAVEVLCFASQSAPVSAGQFGQFPLTVCTSQGMFIMAQGNGEVIYAAVIPLNNEVVWKHSICELGGAFVYAATDGIKLLTGNKIMHLSREVEGEPSDKLTDNTYYVNFITDPNGHLVFLYPYLSAENFLDYLDDNARIAYDKVNRELIITNRDLFLDEGRVYQTPYSYVYNMQSKTWHKITDSWHDFMLINSKWYGVRNFRTGYPTGHGMYSVTDETPVLMDCMIQSRPMKLGSYDFKKPKSVVQRSLCYVGDPIDSSQDADDKFGLYMFASMENNLYKFVKGIKVSQPYGMIQSPTLPAPHQSIRNMVLLTAVKSKDFVLSHWEVLMELTYPGTLGAESRRNTERLIGDYNPDDYNNSEYNTEYTETL